MKQLSKIKSVFYHLYPGMAITICFIVITPLMLRYHYPPQLSLLISIVIIAIPLLIIHLLRVKKMENCKTILEVNGYKNKLANGKLILYALGLVVISFFFWGITQPVDKMISDKFFSWLPEWYRIQDFRGYDQASIRLTLMLNLVINGLLAPFIEELYFRGYLLPRMAVWGKWASPVNAVLFSFYHLWQPHLYLTLILSLLPMTYMVWKTKDLRLAILTHCLLNIIGALLSFGVLAKS